MQMHFDYTYRPSARQPTNSRPQTPTDSTQNRARDMPAFYTDSHHPQEPQYHTSYGPYPTHPSMENVQPYPQDEHNSSQYYQYQNSAYFTNQHPQYNPYPQVLGPNADEHVGYVDTPGETQESGWQEPRIRRGGGSNIRNLECSICGKKFARRSDLVRHERIHNNERPHRCFQCGKQFIQRSALTVHERVHTGDKPHICEKCNKPFSDSSSLARHRRIHTGNRPYKCLVPSCGKTFTRRTTLTRHQLSAHSQSEEAAARAAAVSRNMNTHERTGSSQQGYPQG